MTKTVAERLREAESLCEIHGMCRVVLRAINGKATCPPIASCVDCKKGIVKTLARQIEAEQAELDKRIEVLESDRDDYIEHVTTFGCWQMQIANMLDIPLAERNDSGEVHSKIIAALKGANASTPLIPSISTGLPEGIEWPRFEDGELVKPFDKLPGFDSEGVQKFIWTSSNNGAWQLQDAEGHMLNVMHGEHVKRPEPDVLDADGVPIKVGDTVWDVRDDAEWKVTRIGSDGYIWLNNSHEETPSHFTHRKPDTQEAINHDAALLVSESFFDQRRDEFEDRVFDLLKRQRKLLGGE